jgi:tripartite-type tricarboxylate transporter receptor subunit TctC
MLYSFREESMRIIRNAIALCVVAVGLLVIATSLASAKWPMDKAMTIVVPWPAGTGADLIARVLADGFGKKWGAQVIVENKVGATGNIAQGFVAKAAPDGYTFIVSTPGPAANNMLTFRNLGFNPLTDFTFVTITNEDPMVVVAGPRLAAKDINEFVAYAKANPGKTQFGHPGHGTYAHMTQLSLQDLMGTTFNLIPYRGGPQMTSDMLGGQIDAVIDLLGSYLPLIREGKLRALAVIGNNRIPQLPDVPMLKEVGLNLTAEPWYGLQGPKGIPREIVDQVNAAATEILNDSAVKEKLAAAGITPRTGTPEAFEQLVKKEIEKWRPIVVKYDIKYD